MAVASPSFIKKHGKIKNSKDLFHLPHVLCERLLLDRFAGVGSNLNQIVIRTNDIASARSMAIQGIGWALLPEYAVRHEFEEGLLRLLFEEKNSEEKYGVWRLRSRSQLDSDYLRAIEWLKATEWMTPVIPP